jgi:endonuclease YncB( thermonuclease family)
MMVNFQGGEMSKAIEQLKSGITVGYAALGLRGGVSGSVRQQVHDGDTINVRADGNFGIRFLGIDAPEISFTLPGESKFTGLSNIKWETFLSDPFAENFNPPLDQGLIDYLQARVGAGAAINQHQHATAAEDALEEEVTKDLSVLGQTGESFRFFLAFAYEIMDRYGRFLCFVNRYQLNPAEPEERPPSYNERLLKAGKVCPYFIWPNIDPFRKENSVFKAADSPEAFREKVNNDATLNSARESFRNARQQEIGIFEANNPLRLEPFEVRFLARRQPPDRMVIDLSANDNVLIKPQEYYTVPNSEDRLYIPEEYVPLFVEKGWQRQA